MKHSFTLTLCGEDVHGKTLSVVVVGLMPHQAYELRLSVRYGRLGLRKWTEGLAVVLLHGSVKLRHDVQLFMLILINCYIFPFFVIQRILMSCGVISH